MNDPMIIPTAEPFFFPGGPVGCLLVHGFTGSPKEMRWMGEYLAGQGCSVLGIRLTGHATRPEDMLRARWQDWLADVDSGWHLLASSLNQADQPISIFLIGLSMGSMLSLLFASQTTHIDHPVAGIVGMSTPYTFKEDWRLRFIKPLSIIMPTRPKGPSDYIDSQAGNDHIAYPAYPMRSIAELLDLSAEMRAGLSKVRVPVLLMHAMGDTAGGSFDPQSVNKIYEELGTDDKQILWIEKSGHIIPRDAGRFIAFQATTDFINRIAASHH